MVRAEREAASLGLPPVRPYTNKRLAKGIRPHLGLDHRIDRQERMNRGAAVHMGKTL